MPLLLSRRAIDIIDIVKDQLYGADYVEAEDPKIFVSEKTGRGPLDEDWIESSYQAKKIMCAYKLCRVEFKYWGAQSRVEKFIHDTALRKIMLRAHRQAWGWQDEWFGLTMDDIRRIERETQEHLAQRMAAKDADPSEANQKPAESQQSDNDSDDEFVDAEGS
jgi:hypothetical protein